MDSNILDLQEISILTDNEREKVRGQMDFFKDDWEVYLSFPDEVRTSVKEHLRRCFDEIVTSHAPVALQIAQDNASKRLKGFPEQVEK